MLHFGANIFIKQLRENSHLGSKSGTAHLQPARAQISPRRRWGYRRRVRQDVSGRSFVYNLRLPGQYYDSETGLNYNYKRDYDPATGRYIESDPVGLAGGSFSTYAYVNANPIMAIDPEGLAGAIPITSPLGGGIGIVIGISPIAQPGSPENNSWVNNAYNSIDSGLTALANAIAGKDFVNLPPLEKRAYTRYCRNGDPCIELKLATQQAIQMALLKMNNLLNDPEKMFGTQAWVNHTDDLRGRIDSILAMISLGRKLGCDMNAEIIASTPLFIPTEPLPKIP